MTHYETLEVTFNASPEVIRAAFKSLTQKYHPDRNPGNTDFATMTQDITVAYSILGDSEKRAAYDLFLAETLQKKPRSNGVTAPVVGLQAKKKTVDIASSPSSPSTPIWVFGVSIFVCIAGFVFWAAVIRPENALIEAFIQESENLYRESKVKAENQRTFMLFPNGYQLKIAVLRPTSSAPEVRVWNILPIKLRVGERDSTRVVNDLAKNADILQRAIIENLSEMKEQQLLEQASHFFISERIKTVSNKLILGYRPQECPNVLKNEPFFEDCLGVISVDLGQNVKLE